MGVIYRQTPCNVTCDVCGREYWMDGYEHPNPANILFELKGDVWLNQTQWYLELDDEDRGKDFIRPETVLTKVKKVLCPDCHKKIIDEHLKGKS